MEKSANRNHEEIINSQKEQLTRYETRLKGLDFYISDFSTNNNFFII